ncbi:MAG: biopolymer transporter ExbD [Verrucomicrobia bacterium]|nr:biopolymer transporter ExbD [Verrucomicrobiota bacterium]
MKSRGGNRNNDEVSFQMTPMIDMTFLLLIFFMVTTRLTEESLKREIRLPSAMSAVVPENLKNRDTISIDGEGNYFVGDQQHSREQLAAYLKKRFVNFPPLRIYLRADQDTQARKIREFMTMATEAGALDVIFGTYRKKGREEG